VFETRNENVGGKDIEIIGGMGKFFSLFVNFAFSHTDAYTQRSLQDGTTVFHEQSLDFHDLVKLKPIVKHSNIVEVSKGVWFALKASEPLASVHSRLRFYQRAIRHLKTALQSEPNHVGLLMKLGSCVYELLLVKRQAGIVDKEEDREWILVADEMFQRATEIEPTNFRVYFA
jgi:hypothetical protein